MEEEVVVAEEEAEKQEGNGEKVVCIDFVSLLPEELTLEIFTWLDFRVLRRASYVGREWRRIARDPLLWDRAREQCLSRGVPWTVAVIVRVGLRLASDKRERRWGLPYLVEELRDAPIKFMAAGLRHAMFAAEDIDLYDNRSVQLFGIGRNASGQMGFKRKGYNFEKRVQRGPFSLWHGSTVTGMATGEYHSLFLSNQLIYACGDNTFQQLGKRVNAWRAPFYWRSRPFRPPALSGQHSVREVKCGKECSFFLTTDGVAFGFGRNSHGQLGGWDPGYGDTAIPRQLDPIDDDFEELTWTQISCRLSAVFLLSMDGRVFACGGGCPSILGMGGFEPVFPGLAQVPVLRGEAAVNDHVVELGGGKYHGLALTLRGRVFAWGSNKYGECGSRRTTWPRLPFPLVVEGLDGIRVSKVFEGRGRASYCLDGAFCGCGFVVDEMDIAEDGKLYAWGKNTKGMLPLDSRDKFFESPQRCTVFDNNRILGVVHGDGFTFVQLI